VFELKGPSPGEVVVDMNTFNWDEAAETFSHSDGALATTCRIRWRLQDPIQVGEAIRAHQECIYQLATPISCSDDANPKRKRPRTPRRRGVRRHGGHASPLLS